MDKHFSEEQILQELQRVVNSDEFRNAQRLKQFLTYAVFETLAGRERNLSGYAIGVEVFGRGEDFDPQTNTLVRVTANKLRLKLDHYYSNAGRDNPMRLRLPLGSYLVTAELPPRRTREASDRTHPVMAIESFDCLSKSDEHVDFCKGFLSETCLALAEAECFMLAPPGHMSDLAATDQAKVATHRHADEADLLLTCNLRWSDTRLRVFAQLVEARTRYVVWIDSKEFIWESGDLLDIQADAAAFIADGVMNSGAFAATVEPPEDDEESRERASVH